MNVGDGGKGKQFRSRAWRWVEKKQLPLFEITAFKTRKAVPPSKQKYNGGNKDKEENEIFWH